MLLNYSYLKKIMEKNFYKTGFWLVLIIAVVVILFTSFSSDFKEDSEQTLEERGFEGFISAYEREDENNVSIAVLEMTSQGKDRFYEVLTGLQALIDSYHSAEQFKVLIYEDEDSDKFCEYTVDGELYRDYDDAQIDNWYDSSLLLHFELKQSETC